MNMLFELLKQFDPSMVRDFVSDRLKGCQISECPKLSPGLICTQCSRHVCLEHGYLGVALNPAPKLIPTCAACVIQSHPDLLEESEW